jgi:hypothetical protein
MEQVEKANSFTPTQAMRNNAKRGLALREKWNRGGLNASQAKSEGVGSGVARARDIINGSLSLNTVRRMHAFFSRHEKNFNPSKKESDGGPTAGTIAWYLWGGSAGKAWARSILRKEGILKAVDAEMNPDVEKLEVTKAVNEELKQVTYVAMLPDSVDLHGDYTSEEEVRKAKESFNRSNMQANLFHVAMTDKFSVIESYLAPVDFILGEKAVKKGTWLMTLQVHDDDVWALIKSGEINGISIGALASVETIEEEV